MNEQNMYNITDALLIVALAMHMRGHKYAVWEAAKRIKNRCDAEARSFVVDYVIRAKDPIALIKAALNEVEHFYVVKSALDDIESSIKEEVAAA